MIMTAEEWMACTEPEPMLRLVKGKATNRKLRLFAVACCRHIDHLIQYPRSRMAVDTSEQFADGLVSLEALRRAEAAAATAAGEAFWAVFHGAGQDSPARDAAAAVAAETLMPFRVAYEASTACVWAGSRRLEEMQTAKAEENRFQCGLLRDIFGDPFSPACIDAACLSWHAGTAVVQARAIYERGRFIELPRLADVLRAAGCTSAEVLGHCSQPGPHVRGCWVVDLILGKE
jgi:hypothetical protein